MSRRWLTSDTHFGHANIIEYCGRPFKDVKEMNETIIARWNEVVGREDEVFHLGDFALAPVLVAEEWEKRLNGRIHLVRGNHDGSTSRCKRIGFASVQDMMTIDGCLLIHDPSRAPEGEGRVYCGHVHTAWSEKVRFYNVGVDVRDFRPVEW